MFDNGLLKYYANNDYKDGVLNARDIWLNEEEMVKSNVSICSSEVGNFFKRVNISGQEDKTLTDAQVLLSQIYNKVGLQSAIYFPAQMNGETFLLSNDVSGNNDIVLAYDYISQFPNFQSRFPLDFLNQRHTGELVQRYFTDKALTQQSKLRVYDTACFNNDRHYANFFYNLQDQKVDDIVGIDFELCRCAFTPDDKESDAFYNDFIPFQMPREELMGLFREDEAFATIVDKNALAEEIGSVDPVAVAKDINETIGYKIDPVLPEFLSRTFDEMAETLSL